MWFYVVVYRFFSNFVVGFSRMKFRGAYCILREVLKVGRRYGYPMKKVA